MYDNCELMIKHSVFKIRLVSLSITLQICYFLNYQLVAGCLGYRVVVTCIFALTTKEDVIRIYLCNHSMMYVNSIYFENNFLVFWFPNSAYNSFLVVTSPSSKISNSQNASLFAYLLLFMDLCCHFHFESPSSWMLWFFPSGTAQYC
jgi:hypothetical protein